MWQIHSGVRFLSLKLVIGTFKFSIEGYNYQIQMNGIDEGYIDSSGARKIGIQYS